MKPLQLPYVPHLLVARDVDMRKSCYPIMKPFHHKSLLRAKACWSHKVMFLQSVDERNWKFTVNNISFSNHNQPAEMDGMLDGKTNCLKCFKAEVKFRTSHATNQTERIKFMTSSTLDSFKFVRLCLDRPTRCICLLHTDRTCWRSVQTN